MVSTKLHSIIRLIESHNVVSSANELVRLAEKEGICTRKTVFNLLPELKDHESIRFEKVERRDTFTFVDVTQRKNYAVTKEFEFIEQQIKDVRLPLKAYSKVLKKDMSKELKTGLMESAIIAKRQIIRSQQRLVHFEACGFKTRSVKEQFDNIKSKLVKLDLELHRRVYRLDHKTAADLFLRIDYEHSEEAFSHF